MEEVLLNIGSIVEVEHAEEVGQYLIVGIENCELRVGKTPTFNRLIP